jgi:hypothetical protein
MVRLRTGARRFAMRAALTAATACALASSASAQWLPPFGAAAPAEIVQRLGAEGYVLAGPLVRRETVYLADVARGPRGKERLVLDAWSGEILQRFLARRGGFAPEGGDFSEPPPLGPPPARDFDGGGASETTPKGRKPKSAATAHRSAEPKSGPPASEQPAEPQNARIAPGTAAPAPAAAATPTQAVAPGAPAAGEPAQAQAPAAEPAGESAPASSPSHTSPTDARPATAAKPGEKRVNDVPVNPLD